MEQWRDAGARAVHQVARHRPETSPYAAPHGTFTCKRVQGCGCIWFMGADGIVVHVAQCNKCGLRMKPAQLFNDNSAIGQLESAKMFTDVIFKRTLTLRSIFRP